MGHPNHYVWIAHRPVGFQTYWLSRQAGLETKETDSMTKTPAEVRDGPTEPEFVCGECGSTFDTPAIQNVSESDEHELCLDCAPNAILEELFGPPPVEDGHSGDRSLEEFTEEGRMYPAHLESGVELDDLVKHDRLDKSLVPETTGQLLDDESDVEVIDHGRDVVLGHNLALLQEPGSDRQVIIRERQVPDALPVKVDQHWYVFKASKDPSIAHQFTIQLPENNTESNNEQ